MVNEVNLIDFYKWLTNATQETGIFIKECTLMDTDGNTEAMVYDDKYEFYKSSGRENMELTAKQVKELHDVLSIQKSDGNWNANDYMLGMYNGMELMMSIIESRDTQYRSKSMVATFEK